MGRYNRNTVKNAVKEAINSGKNDASSISNHLKKQGIPWDAKRVGMWIFHNMKGEITVVKTRAKKSRANRYFLGG